MNEVVKVNFNLDLRLDEWIQKRAKEMRITRTALIHLALEQYMNGTELMKKEKGLGELIDTLGELSQAIENGKLKIIEDKKD